MRQIIPIGVMAFLFVMGCSKPRSHDPNLIKKPRIPYVEEVANPGPMSEGSLWQDRTLVGDLRAGRLNDLVTIRINESTNAIAKADVSTNRDGSNRWASPSLFSRLGKIGILSGGTDPKTTSTTNKYKGTGTTGRSATFNTTVTARVVKVLQNGNLIFEGCRDIQLNNETQRLYVAGMLDPMRLDNANSISSYQIAEFRVGYGGDGVVDETLKPGYISRILNFIWPF